jgi:hypothetical protein
MTYDERVELAVRTLRGVESGEVTPAEGRAVARALQRRAKTYPTTTRPPTPTSLQVYTPGV